GICSVLCPLCEALKDIQAGRHPALLAELTRSWAVLGNEQGCRGWCVLILKDHIEHLDHLSPSDQAALFEDVARMARAIRRAFPDSGTGGGPPRINYECLGNQVAHVHWHVIPRHADDPTPTRPVWLWTPEQLRGTMGDAERRALIVRLRGALAGV